MTLLEGGGDTSSRLLCGITVPVGNLGLQPPNISVPPRPSRYAAGEGNWGGGVPDMVPLSPLGTLPEGEGPWEEVWGGYLLGYGPKCPP